MHLDTMPHFDQALQRIEAWFANEIIDRPPVALWRHFPVDDQSPQLLAAAHLNYQQNYEFDLMKVTPASSFCLKDWGVEDELLGDTEGTRRYNRRVIHAPEDWESLTVLEPTSPYLAQQLECLRLISIHALLPDLIEAGYDVINPVQTSCRDMEPERLKREFGKDICFWGGGGDTRSVLPRGTPAEVKEHVKRRCDILAPGGGFVFNTVHNILPEVPPENVVALFEGIAEWGGTRGPDR